MKQDEAGHMIGGSTETIMPTRSIALAEEEDRIVDDLVKSGRFNDADAVVREGLRLVAESEEDENFGYTPEELKAGIQVGSDDLDNGRYTEFASVEKFVAHLKQLGGDIKSGKVDR